MIRKVWDSTGSGRADKSDDLLRRLQPPQDGLGSGVLARKGNVYYTNIPDLSLLQDTNGDGKADEKKSLFTGFGVRVAVRRPRHARPPHGAGRQALLLHRRPRLQRQDQGRQATQLPEQRRRAPLRPGRLATSEIVHHRPPQPAGTRLRRFRQPLHLRQQLRQRRPGPLGPHRRGRRQRGNVQTGGYQDFDVLVDNVVVATVRPADTTYRLYSTGPFQVTAGTHTIAFRGRNTAGGDDTALLDNIASELVQATQPTDAGFERPSAGPAGSFGSFITARPARRGPSPMAAAWRPTTPASPRTTPPPPRGPRSPSSRPTARSRSPSPAGRPAPTG